VLPGAEACTSTGSGSGNEMSTADGREASSVDYPIRYCDVVG